jgi:acetylornithine deacetylase/succinyl-diaminopimelate desuccinylase-like protein
LLLLLRCCCAAAVLLLLLPQAGTITINFRLLPGDTSDTIRQQLLHWLGPDAAHAAIAFTDKWETPAAVTDPNGPYFALVKDAIQEAWRLKGPATSAAEQGEKQHAAAAVAASQASRDTQQQQQQQQQKHTQEDMLLKAGHTVGSASSSRAKQLPVIPYLLCGGTDSKWYANLTRNIVRFAPFSVNRRAGDLKRVHGTDERLSVGDFVRMLCTFKAGMKMAGLHMHLGSEAIHTPTVFKSAAAAAAAAVQHSPADSNSGKSMDAEAACSEGLQQAVEGDSSSRAEASGEL